MKNNCYRSQSKTISFDRKGRKFYDFAEIKLKSIK